MVFFWGCLLGRNDTDPKRGAMIEVGPSRADAGGGNGTGTGPRARSFVTPVPTPRRRDGEACRAPRVGPCLEVERNSKRRRGRNSSASSPHHHPTVVPTLASSSPPPPLPTYRLVLRSQCRLLQLCYEQQWTDVLTYCTEESSSNHRKHNDVCFRTKDTLRTSLHLSTLPGTFCPPHVLTALLRANPHAVTVQDHPLRGSGAGNTSSNNNNGSSTSSTPLHFLCGGRHKNNVALVQSFVDAAILYETSSYVDSDTVRRDISRLPYGRQVSEARLYSPLFVACRENARPEVIQVLVSAAFGVGTASSSVEADDNDAPGKARPAVAPWIAPITGAEPWDETNATEVPAFVPLAELWKQVRHQFREFENNTSMDPHVVTRMRRVARTQLLPAEAWNGTHESTPDASDEPVVVDDLTRAWMSIIVLIKPHIKSFHVLLHAVVNNAFPTAVPIVDLYHIVCRLFPELLIERDDHGQVSLHCTLQRQLHLQSSTAQPAPSAGPSTWPVASPSFWTKDILPGLVRFSIHYKLECATVMDPTSRLFPALQAASIDAPVSVVFDLVLASVACLFGNKSRRTR